MDIQRLLAGGDAVASASLIGVGQFGRTLLAQSRRMPSLDVRVLCDRDVVGLLQTCASVGLDVERIAVVDGRDQAMAAFDAGKTVVTQNSELAIATPVDVVVEATGDPEAGALNALAAIEAGKHVAMATKEADSVVGVLLANRARAAGVTLSQIDGDQPSLLLGLISWARTLGFEIACAGKASEHDFVVDLEAGRVRLDGHDLETSLTSGLWDAPGSVVDRIAQRSDALSALPQRAASDFCELCLIANASGLTPDLERLHAPVARVVELADYFRSTEDGGALGGDGRLDLFNCFRRPDEISAAGGVFVVLRAPDEETGRLFQSKSIPTSADGRHVLVYNPTHLLGSEAPITILSAHRLGLSTSGGEVAPVCDVTMRATRDLAAGERLSDVGRHRRIDGVEATLRAYQPFVDDAPAPYFLAAGHRLARDVPTGARITRSMLAPPDDSALWRLREAQDAELAMGAT